MQRIIVIEDHHLVRTAVQGLLQQWFEPAEVNSAASMAEAEHLLDRHGDVNILVLDLDLPDSKGLDSIDRLRALHPSIPIVVFSAYDTPPFVQQCLRSGAAAHLSKASYPRELVDAVRQHARSDTTTAGEQWSADRTRACAAAGGLAIASGAQASGSQSIRLPATSLTDRQYEVLHLLCKGLPTRDIAARMNLCSSTIKTHLTQIYKSLRVRNRFEAMLIAQRLNGGVALQACVGEGGRGQAPQQTSPPFTTDDGMRSYDRHRTR